MTRVVKKAEVRRNEILMKAQELFYTNGYNNTSVSMVIEALGISKGAFYHYFKSKEELLDSLSNTLTTEIKKNLLVVVADPDLNAIDKLNKLYYVSGSYKVENINVIMTITEALYKDDNLLLRYKFQRKSIDDFVPLMAAIFQQGKDEGVFAIENPKVMARTILMFGVSIAEHNAKLLLQLNEHPEKLDEMYEHFIIYQRSVERMLNAPEGSVIAFDKKFFKAFGIFLKESK
ncbi:TetR/AcrR family transcriptional regulator [Candidatus Cloacimonadota bacterium]